MTANIGMAKNRLKAIKLPVACSVVLTQINHVYQKLLFYIVSRIIIMSSPARSATPVEDGLEIGAVVEIHGAKGTIRFVGTTSFATGRWVGIELTHPTTAPCKELVILYIILYLYIYIYIPDVNIHWCY
jgi:hypothetical protein